MKILIDIDGVVAGMHVEWLRKYNQDWNDDLKPSDITRWATHEFVKPECGIKIFEYLWDETLYDNVLPINGALQGVISLRSMGHRCVFVTSGIQPAKIKWLFRNGFLNGKVWQSDSDVIIAHDKSLIPGDLLIDDYPKNVEEFKGETILFDQPWNREYHYTYRAMNWYDILSCIESENL